MDFGFSIDGLWVRRRVERVVAGLAGALKGTGWGIAVAVLSAGVPAAGADSSLSDLDIEFSEAKLTLESVSAENEQLRRELRLAREQIGSLTESLAVAQNEAEVFRREGREMRLKMEALGLDAVSPDRSKLEQRLLKALRDLELAEADKRKLADSTVALCESVVRFLQTAESKDADARMHLELSMRGASEALGVSPPNAVEASAVPASLTEAMVISVKSEMALVVANVGRMQGVAVGMPFQVWRGGKRIALVRVVDVREKISGAVVQELGSEKEQVKVGDRLKVDAR